MAEEFAKGGEMAPKKSGGPTNPSPVDSYDGKYKDVAVGMSEEDRFGGNLNPVVETPTPFTGMKKMGG